MNAKLRAVRAAVAAILMCGSALAEDARDEYTETIELVFPLKSGGQFSLDNRNGSLHVTTWDKDEVKIVAEKRMRLDDGGVAWLWRLVGLKASEVKTDEEAKAALAGLKVQTEGDDTRRDVTTEYPSDYKGVNFSVTYHVTTPRNVELRAELTNGKVDVEDVEGSVDVQSVNGTVTLSRVTGEAQARSTNGRVNVEDASGDVVARTTNGSVSVELREGPIGDVELRSVNGSVTLGARQGSAFALEMQTVHGSAVCDLPIDTVDEQSRKRIRGRVGEGGGSVSLETTNGSARIRQI